MPRNELLQYWRERHQLTQAELAERVGADLKTEQKWEAGVTDPYPVNLSQLTALLGKSPRELGIIRKNEWPPIPYLKLDYHLDKFFTGREDILQRLHDLLPQLRQDDRLYFTALVGVGGVGKTHVAIEYAHRHMHEYQTVVFLNASSRETLTNEFSYLASSLFNLVERGIPLDQEIVMRVVKEWLGNFSLYLLVFDNVNDLSMIADFLPLKIKGDIIAITQSQPTGTYAQPIYVEPMNKEEGIRFLLRRAKGTENIAKDTPLQEVPDSTIDLAREVVKLLGGLPLALDQAGAYIEETVYKDDVAKGLTHYISRYHRERKRLLERRGAPPSLDHPASVMTTFTIALNKIKSVNPFAVELLKFFAFLEPDNIPKELILKNAAVLGPRFQSFVSNPAALEDAVEDAIAALLRFSLIRRKVNEGAYSIHRLVQAIAQDKMRVKERRMWVERAVTAVYNVFPEVEIETLRECQAYLPTAVACLKHIEQLDMIPEEAVVLLERLGAYLIIDGAYSASEFFLSLAFALFANKMVKPSDKSNKLIRRILHRLAYACRKQAKRKEAQEWLRSLLEDVCVRGGCSPDEKACYSLELALVLAQERQIEEAIQYYNAAADLDVSQEFADNMTTNQLLNITTLSDLLTHLALLDASMPETEKILNEIYIQGLTHHAPKYYIARWKANLGIFYYSKQNPDLLMAERYLRLALGWLSNVGELDDPLEHPDAIPIYAYLGDVYRLLEEYEDAVRALEQALARAQKFYGDDHFETFTIAQKLADTYALAKNYEEAILLYNKLIAMTEEHKRYDLEARCCFFLGVVYQLKGEHSRAEQTYIKGLPLAEMYPDDKYDLAGLFRSRLRELTSAS